jgi:ABC-type uncharacterized transport system ATPase subunit
VRLHLDRPGRTRLGVIAGKTTLIGAVCNLVRPTAGEIRVAATAELAPA